VTVEKTQILFAIIGGAGFGVGIGTALVTLTRGTGSSAASRRPTPSPVPPGTAADIGPGEATAGPVATA
jgi:hypothetical protein